MRAHHRHVAGVVMRALVLLVGLVVLLIDDDQAEIGVGQKQRRARADHDLRFARRDRRPVARAGARRQFGMPFQRPHAEARGEAVEELAGQRDLRHQDQRLLAAPDDFGDRFEIDFGLAGAGDAVEQRDVKTAIGRQRRASRPRRCAAGGEKSGSAKDGSGAGGGSARGIGSTVSVPSSTRPSITPALTPASLAASDLPCSRPSDKISISRRRAGVMRFGAARRSAARPSAPARARDARPSAASSAAPCRAPTACSWRPSRPACAVPASAAARRAFRRRP